jgi:hypothetical protein
MLVAFHLSFGAMLFWLMVGHVLADYPLQGDFLAVAKNHNTPVGKLFWPYALSAHALIHAAFVALFTGSIALGLAEALIHAATDRLKCNEKISLLADQLVHIACKIVWAVIAVYLWRT